MAMTLPAQSSATVVDPDLLSRLTALRQTLAPTLTDAELELFGLVAQRKGLDPFSGQILAVKRQTRQGPRVTYQTGIDGYRSLAARTDEYLGSDDAEFGPPCDCGQAPKDHPTFARVVVHRWHEKSGQVVDQPGRADWHEFVPSEDFMWREKPHVMIAKCAEAQALRKAFPWVLGDLYIPEEMARADDAPAPQPAVVTARETVAARAAAIRGDDDPQAAQDGPGDEAEPGAVFTPSEPETPPPGPSTAVGLELTPHEFQARLAAAGMTVDNAKTAAAELFPGRPSASLNHAEWGQLWQVLERAAGLA